MIVYNVTCKVDLSIHEEWLEWMKSVHIPDVMNTKCFTSFALNYLMGTNEEDGITYTVQYYTKDLETLQQYKEKYAAALQADYKQKFEGKYVAFRSLMRVVDQS